MRCLLPQVNHFGRATGTSTPGVQGRTGGPFKEAYFRPLKDAQRRLDWPSAIGFLSDVIVGTVDELMATRTALEDLRRIWLGRRTFRGGSAAQRALALLPQYPVITVRRPAASARSGSKSGRSSTDAVRRRGVEIRYSDGARIVTVEGRAAMHPWLSTTRFAAVALLDRLAPIGSA